jgi:hypothetical protein
MHGKAMLPKIVVAAGKRISEEEGNYSLMPSSTMLRLHSAEGCVDVVIRVFPVTSTSLSIVSWGLFGSVYGVLGSVCAVSSSLFTRGFVNGRIVEPISV